MSLLAEGALVAVAVVAVRSAVEGVEPVKASSSAMTEARAAVMVLTAVSMLLAAVFSSVFCASSQIITEVETEEISRLSVAMEASEAEAVITLVSSLDFVSTSAQVVAIALWRRDPDRALTTFSAALAASSLAFSVLAWKYVIS